jgi:hypothetical protein
MKNELFKKIFEERIAFNSVDELNKWAESENYKVAAIIFDDSFV